MHKDGGPLSQSKPVHLPDSNSARVSRSHILWKFITLVMHVIHICLLLQRSLTRSNSSGIATGAHTSTSGSNGLHWYGGCFFFFFFFFFFLGGGGGGVDAVSCFQQLMMTLRHGNFLPHHGRLQGEIAM